MEKLQVVILGGILGFILSILKDYFFASKKQKTERYYLAIITSASLESFISKCLEVAGDEGDYNEQGCLSPKVSLPNFEPMLLDVNWQSLEKELLYEILTLPEKIKEANAYIFSANEYVAGPPNYEEYFNARKLKYAELGLTASSILSKLQTSANLHKPKPSEWSREKVLKKIREATLKKIKASEKRSQETLRSLAKNIEKND